MDKFTRVCGVAAPLLAANVNTDAIMPSQWGRDHPDDFGGGLFGNWRFISEGVENSEFVLNLPRYRNATFLICGPNFGCGSARETAVWAIVEYGIRGIIAPSFADIFRDNAFQNGVLIVDLPQQQVDAVVGRIEVMPEPVLCIDLERCTVEAGGEILSTFSVAADRRQALLEGLDETLMLRHMEAEIGAFQGEDRQRRPWIYAQSPSEKC